MVLSVHEVADAYESGQSLFRYFRKAPTQATGQGIWFDTSMSPGIPIPNYYAASPNVAIALARSTDGGLDHGGNVSPKVKYLHKLMMMNVTATPLPMPMIICDYLMYYPFVDMSTTDTQAMTTNITIPRYTTGAGVKVMAVCVAAQAGGSSFFITYTNSDGVAGRTSATVTVNAQALNGTIVTTATATAGAGSPFIPLQSGDTGIQLIESVTFVGTDVGLISLVLVKPLAQFTLYDITAPVEKDFIIDHSIAPIIKDDAYLNILACPFGSLASTVLLGTIETFWSDN